MQNAETAAGETTLFNALFDELSDGRSVHDITQHMNRLRHAQKRVRRILDRGVPRSQGEALKKTVAALVIARGVLQQCCTAAANRGR